MITWTSLTVSLQMTRFGMSSNSASSERLIAFSDLGLWGSIWCLFLLAYCWRCHLATFFASSADGTSGFSGVEFWSWSRAHTREGQLRTYLPCRSSRQFHLFSWRFGSGASSALGLDTSEFQRRLKNHWLCCIAYGHILLHVWHNNLLRLICIQPTKLSVASSPNVLWLKYYWWNWIGASSPNSDGFSSSLRSPAQAIASYCFVFWQAQSHQSWAASSHCRWKCWPVWCLDG